MAGVLDGVEVLDLSWGIAGPVTGMLLADHGARVTKIEPPGGDPTRAFSGAKVWHRGKRRAVLDLKDPADRDRFLALASRADIVLEAFSPGVTARLGIDDDTLRARNPRLVYTSITPYGIGTKHSDRRGYEALVAARTGQQWESRGIEGGTIARLSGVEGALPGLQVPDDCWTAAKRPGPLFAGTTWASMATAYLATLATSAALRARELTGRGQHVETSLLQGVLATTVGGWQQAERPDSPNFQSWVIDPRAPKGVFRCKDGRWIHHWTPLPAFVLGVSEGDTLEITDEVTSPKEAPMRIGLAPEEMVLLHHYNPLMAERFAKFTSDEWVAIAAKVGTPVQPIRSPEEALLDELLVGDGCVVEVDDLELGPVRQVGRVYQLHNCPDDAPIAAVAVGTHTDDVRAEADALVAAGVPTVAPSDTPAPASPLAGVRVLDLGLAVAGPWGTMMLGDLGADVIKVNTLYDGYWMSNHIGMACNRGKRSISVNLKDPKGMEILHRLVETAEVVQHNMRYDAAVRLGVDYESLKKIRPDLIYCHTRGFEKSERELLPGNDQTGAALAGPDWLDGALDNDGTPLWPVISLGDTGNGFLSAIGMVQALYHRDRTGEGQFVDTSIIYAQLLNASIAWITADGKTRGDRPSVDAMQLGWNALYRLYPTAGDTWLCIAVIEDDEWQALCRALGRDDLASDARFTTAAGRAEHRDALAAILEPVFADKPAAEWFALLDPAGVPVEVSSPDFVLDLFSDPEILRRQWIAEYVHPAVGRMRQFGLMFDMSETPGTIQGPPLTPGMNTREILRELDYDTDQIGKFEDDNVVLDTSEQVAGVAG
jgi:crotonobetainyl-CoA:carnitine CoA-transferase CaiB-like acyl-CoA transferase